MTEQEFLKWWYTEFKFSYTDNLATSNKGYATFNITVGAIPDEVKDYIDEYYGGAITFSVAYLKPHITKGNYYNSRLLGKLFAESPYQRGDYLQTYNYWDGTFAGCDKTSWVFCNDLYNEGSYVLDYESFPSSPIQIQLNNYSIYKTLHQEHEHPSLDPACYNKGGSLGNWLHYKYIRQEKYDINPPSIFSLRYTVVAHLGDNPGFGKIIKPNPSEPWNMISWFKDKGHPIGSDIHTININIDDIWRE